MGFHGLFKDGQWLWVVGLQWVTIAVVHNSRGGSLTDLGLDWVDLEWIVLMVWVGLIFFFWGFDLVVDYFN